MGIRCLLVSLSILVLVAACATKAPPKEELPAWKGEIVAHKKVIVEGKGIVGWMKIREFSRPGYGPPYKLYYVYDLQHKELGFVSPRGTAVKYVQYAPEIAKVQGKEFDSVKLPAQPLAWNVAKILEIDDKVKIVAAKPSDVQ